MSGVDAQRVRELFDRACEVTREGRGAFLDRECADAEVRREVESLLKAHDSGTFLSDPAKALEGWVEEAGAEGQGGDPLIGHTFGRYHVLSVLGAGGMGIVYEARQDNPRRTVALKVMRAGMMTAPLLRRFEQEAQVLGRLQHPGIAQIFEAGTGRDRLGLEQPFFAMELVHGRGLLEYAAESNLGTREKLELFSRVCDAVQHAHQKGVIHRDLKPGNILVDEGGTGPADSTATGTALRTATTGVYGPQPKILDFGVARITDWDVALTTMQTDVGQVVGTLQYMSPEQARGESHLLDTRTDVYSLGVILFELLTGRSPYDVRKKPLPEAARIINEQDPALISTADRALRGDLETIVSKALCKEPERRYQSVAELGADVRRYLGDLPIIARPATTTYHLRKFARRNKALVSGVCIAFVMLVLGVIGTTLGMLRAIDAEAIAKAREKTAAAEARKAKKSEEFLITMLTSADPDQTAGKDPTVREVLDQASKGVGESLKDDPEVHLSARKAIGRTYRAVGAPDKAEPHLLAALDLTDSLFGTQSEERALMLHELSHVHTDRHDWRKVIDVGTQSLTLLEAQAVPDLLAIARSCALLSGAYVAVDDMKNGEAFARRALSLATQAEGKAEVAEAAGILAEVLQRKGGKTASAEGEQFARLQVESLAAANGPVHSATLKAKETLGWFLASERRTAEALPILLQVEEGYRTLYGPNHRVRLNVLTLLARVYTDTGELVKAKEIGTQAVEGLRAAAPQSPELGHAYSRLGRAMTLQGKLSEAEACYRESRAIYLAAKDPRANVALSMLGSVLDKQGKFEEALVFQSEAIDARRASGNLLSDFGTMLNNRAVTLSKLGRLEEAEKNFRESVEHDAKARPGNPLNGYNLRAFALFLSNHQRDAEAEPMLREAYSLSKAQSPQDRRSTGTQLLMLLQRVGKQEEVASLKAELDALPQPPAPAK